MRYYIDNSAWFDSHRYDKAKIAKAVASEGGTNIRSSLKYGWRNQPSVVTFTSNSNKVGRIEHAIGRALGSFSIFARKKDW